MKLANGSDWQEYCKSGEKPKNIPSSPNYVYKDKGYTHMGNWLGTGRVPEVLRVYQDFETARSFVHELKLKNTKEWNEYCKSGDKPENIPIAPASHYKNKGWVSMGDWLGSGVVAAHKMVYRNFEDAREFARSLNLKSSTEWGEYCKSGKKPFDIPSNVNNTYKKKGWNGFQDWLGNNNNASSKNYCSFKQAREFAKSLKLNSAAEWRDYCKKNKIPIYIPKNPYYYKDKGWKGFGDFLGTGSIGSQNRVYKDFSSARKFIHSLKLKSSKEWFIYLKEGGKPNDIPTKPERTYKDKGWIGMSDWLGHGKTTHHNIKYREFDKARTFARSLKLSSVKEWKEEYCKSGKKPIDIPTNAYQKYQNKGWKGWVDFLGKE